MPIYEFRCCKCGHKFDSLLDDLPTKHVICMRCGLYTASKCISTPAIHFKGTGWPGKEIKEHGEKRT